MLATRSTMLSTSKMQIKIESEFKSEYENSINTETHIQYCYAKLCLNGVFSVCDGNNDDNNDCPDTK